MFEIHLTDEPPELDYYGTIKVGYRYGRSLEEQWDKIIQRALDQIHGTFDEEGNMLTGADFPHVNELNWRLEYVDIDNRRREVVRIFNNQ